MGQVLVLGLISGGIYALFAHRKGMPLRTRLVLTFLAKYGPLVEQQGDRLHRAAGDAPQRR